VIMNFICQQEALNNIKILSEHRQHGVVITGDSGCGKTYIARKYAKLLNIRDFYIINPVISDLKTMIDTCVSATNPVVMCIENLDDGVTQASYPLLKLIEDCPSHLYVVVTCCNMYGIPDTILSRCAVVNINPPTRSDIDQYAESKDATTFTRLSKHKIWSCVKSMSDVDAVLKFAPEQLKYFDDLDKLNFAKDTVSNLSWKLQHYEDKSETPVVLVVRYLMQLLEGHGRRACLDCLNDLADNRMSKNAIISKLVFENKYCR